MLKVLFPESRVGETGRTWVFPCSSLSAVFLQEMWVGEWISQRNDFAVSSGSGSQQDHPLPGTEGCQGRLWDPGAPQLSHPPRAINNPCEAARPQETEEMKLIHGNVSLFSHLLLGAGRLLPVTPIQPRLSSGLGGALREPSWGRSVEEWGYKREKRAVQVCWSCLETEKGLFLGVKGEKGAFPCGFGASPVRDAEPGEGGRAVRGRGDAP